MAQQEGTMMKSREKTMRQWDMYRKMIADGCTTSLPRDWFESELDIRDEAIAELKKALAKIAGYDSFYESSKPNICVHGLTADEPCAMCMAYTAIDALINSAEIERLDRLNGKN